MACETVVERGCIRARRSEQRGRKATDRRQERRHDENRQNTCGYSKNTKNRNRMNRVSF